MYKSFEVKNFRCFSDVTIEPLARVNLVAGKNNVGKTALLEALWLHHGAHNPQLGFRIDGFRGLEVLRLDRPIWSIFHNFDDQSAIETQSKDYNGRVRIVKMRVQPQTTTTVEPEQGAQIESTTGPLLQQLVIDFEDETGQKMQSRALVEPGNIRFESALITPPSAIFLIAHRYIVSTTDAERLGNLEETGELDAVVEVLKIIEPRLKRLSVLYRGERPLIFGDVGGSRLIPLPLMGDGMSRLLIIALAIGNAQKGAVLIDEVENGIHHTVMKNVWQAIAHLAQQYDAQLFATTHSEEAIRAAHDAFSGDTGYDFRLHRLERRDGEIHAYTYEKEELEAALQTGLEVR